ncbi:ribbon-helix-helix domain-containing protein [Coleofasciculus sp.]|uniref:ribbon-helix-helix domain-containing protein n=1 Tax=Coleofasciculus sp. TaxID=3100458 RepID=UPI003A177892
MPDRISVDIQGLREPLESLAAQEERTLNQMIRFLVKEGLERRGILVPDRSTNPYAFLKALANGELTDAQLVELAHDLDMREEKLLQLRDCLLNLEKLTNGA